MSLAYFAASFGGVDMRITSIRTDGGRDVVVQSPSRGSKHYLQDRGQRFGKSECEVMFCDEPRKAPFLARYVQFRDLVNAGEASVFTHPLDGSYIARAADMTVTLDDSGCVKVSVSFLPEDEPDPQAPPGAGAAPTAGVEAASTAGADVKVQTSASKALSPAGKAAIPSIVDQAIATVAKWAANADILSSEILGDLGQMSVMIANAIEDYQLATDVKNWSVYRSTMMFFYQTNRAAEAFSLAAPTSISVVVAKTAPLLPILAEVYGASLALDRLASVAQQNRIANPGRVFAGTIIDCPGAGARQ